MNEKVYLTIAEVLTMHHALIEEFGGTQGLRDKGMLESALFRPQIGYYQHGCRGSRGTDGVISEQSRIPRWKQENRVDRCRHLP